MWMRKGLKMECSLADDGAQALATAPRLPAGAGLFSIARKNWKLSSLVGLLCLATVRFSLIDNNKSQTTAFSSQVTVKGMVMETTRMCGEDSYLLCHVRTAWQYCDEQVPLFVPYVARNRVVDKNSDQHKFNVGNTTLDISQLCRSSRTTYYSRIPESIRRMILSEGDKTNEEPEETAMRLVIAGTIVNLLGTMTSHRMKEDEVNRMVQNVLSSLVAFVTIVDPRLRSSTTAFTIVDTKLGSVHISTNKWTKAQLIQRIQAVAKSLWRYDPKMHRDPISHIPDEKYKSYIEKVSQLDDLQFVDTTSYRPLGLDTWNVMIWNTNACLIPYSSNDSLVTNSCRLAFQEGPVAVREIQLDESGAMLVWIAPAFALLLIAIVKIIKPIHLEFSKKSKKQKRLQDYLADPVLRQLLRRDVMRQRGVTESEAESRLEELERMATMPADDPAVEEQVEQREFLQMRALHARKAICGFALTITGGILVITMAGEVRPGPALDAFILSVIPFAIADRYWYRIAEKNRQDEDSDAEQKGWIST